MPANNMVTGSPTTTTADLELYLEEAETFFERSAFGRLNIEFELYTSDTADGWYPRRGADPNYVDHALFRAVDSDYAVDWNAATGWMTIWATSDADARSGTDPGSSRFVDFDDDGIAEHELEGAFVSLKHHGNSAVLRHELGHTFALRHAEFYNMYRGDAEAVYGHSMAYGDQACTMGSNFGHINGAFAEWLGWLPPRLTTRLEDPALSDPSLDSVASVTLYPLSADDDNTTRLVRVASHSGVEYWVEARRAVGSDIYLEGMGRRHVLDGVSIRQIGITGDESPLIDRRPVSYLIDPTPETPHLDGLDAILLQGRTFSDHAEGVHITVVDSDDDSDGYATIEVHWTDTTTANSDPEITSLSVRGCTSGPPCVAAHAGVFPSVLRELEATAFDADGDDVDIFWAFDLDGYGDYTPAILSDDDTFDAYEPGSYYSGPLVTHAFSTSEPLARRVFVMATDRRGGTDVGWLDLDGYLNLEPTFSGIESPLDSEPLAEGAAAKLWVSAGDLYDEQPTWFDWQFVQYGGLQPEYIQAPWPNAGHEYADYGCYKVRTRLSDLELRTQLHSRWIWVAPGSLDPAGTPCLCGSDVSDADCDMSSVSIGGDHSDKQFQGASLRDAQLLRVRAQRSNFWGVNFSHADVARLNARWATFTQTDWVESQVWRANFRDTDFAEADLSNSWLNRVDFRGSDLHHARFANADVQGGRFQNTDLTRADFSGARLSWVFFNRADLTGADFTDADLSAVFWHNATCPDGSRGRWWRPCL